MCRPSGFFGYADANDLLLNVPLPVLWQAGGVDRYRSFRRPDSLRDVRRCSAPQFSGAPGRSLQSVSRRPSPPGPAWCRMWGDPGGLRFERYTGGRLHRVSDPGHGIMQGCLMPASRLASKTVVPGGTAIRLPSIVSVTVFNGLSSMVDVLSHHVPADSRAVASTSVSVSI